MNATAPVLTLDAPCPACGYNLRGLTALRCPECGEPFEWLDVMQPGTRRHPYLFEHHPDRNLWSFRRTAWGGLRPRRFWSPLHRAHPSRPGRMLAYWALAMAVALAGVVAVCAAGWFVRVHWLNALASPPRPAVPVPQQIIRLPRQSYFQLQLMWAWFLAAALPWLAWLAWGVCWPWLTLAALSLLRRVAPRSELGNPAVTSLSLLRCCLYSADVLLWAGLAVVALAALGASLALADLVGLPADWEGVCGLVLPVFAFWCVYKLGVGLETYLRVGRPWRWVVASQAIVVAVGVVAAAALWRLRR